MDLSSHRLYRRRGCSYEQVPLPHKFARVLVLLVENAGEWVPVATILERIWSTKEVDGERALVNASSRVKTAIYNIRKVLEDDARRPRLIRSSREFGYQYVDGIRLFLPQSTGLRKAWAIGRDKQLDRLEEALTRAQAGTPQFVLISGPAGIGKTELANAFLERIPTQANVLFARGASMLSDEVEVSNESLTQALTALLQVPNVRPTFGKMLWCHAPDWAQVLMDPSPPDSYAQHPERWHDEPIYVRLPEAIAQFTEAYGATLVLLLEDLHWADRSTLTMIARLAVLPEPARVLIICSRRTEYDPTHPAYLSEVLSELERKAHHNVIELGSLPRSDITTYVRNLLPGLPPDPLAHRLWRLTKGNPLHTQRVVEDLIARGSLTSSEGSWKFKGPPSSLVLDAPRSLRAMLLHPYNSLDPGLRTVLDAAATVGHDVSSKLAAHTCGISLSEVEDALRELCARGRLELQETTRLDSTFRFDFRHPLEREVVYAEIPIAARRLMHYRAAEYLQLNNITEGSCPSAVVALHLLRAGRRHEAHPFLVQGANEALNRGGSDEARELLGAALRTLPEAVNKEERAMRELELLVMLGMVSVQIKGFADDEVRATFQKAGRLARRVAGPNMKFLVVRGMFAYSIGRADLPRALKIGGQLLDIAKRENREQQLLQEGYTDVGSVLVHQGWPTMALGYLGDTSRRKGKREAIRSHTRECGHNPILVGRAYAAWAKWLSGDARSSARISTSNLKHARQFNHTYSLVFVMGVHGLLLQLRERARDLELLSREAINLCTENGYAHWLGMHKVLRGWALFETGRQEEGALELEEGLDLYRYTGAELMLPYYECLLGDLLLKAGEADRALNVLRDSLGLARRNGELWCAPEILRLLGVGILQSGSAPARRQATTRFRQSLRYIEKRELIGWEPSLEASMLNASISL